MTAAAEQSRDGVEIASRVNDPIVQQRYGGRERPYWVLGGVQVTDVDGRVWYACQRCPFTGATPHAIAVHRGWKHPTAQTTRTVTGHRRDARSSNGPVGDLADRVERLAERLRAAEADRDEWRGRALNAEAAARVLREGGG